MIKPTILELDQLKNVKFTKLMLIKKALSQLAVGVALFTCHKMDYVNLMHLYCIPLNSSGIISGISPSV